MSLNHNSFARESFISAPNDLFCTHWISHLALPPLPTEAQFTQIIDHQGLDAARQRMRSIRLDDSTAQVFDEEFLIQYVFRWGPDRADDLKKLLNLNLEPFPQSADTWFWLAQVNLSLDIRDQAVTALKQALALKPDHARAKKLLQRLKN